MLLAPRQLQRHGMTGAVPYYGGRLTPAHIYGIQQQARQGAAPPRHPVRRPLHPRHLRPRCGTSGRRTRCATPSRICATPA